MTTATTKHYKLHGICHGYCLTWCDLLIPWLPLVWTCHFFNSETLPVTVNCQPEHARPDGNYYFWLIRIRMLCVFIGLSIRLWNSVIPKADRHLRLNLALYPSEAMYLSKCNVPLLNSAPSGKKQASGKDNCIVSFALASRIQAKISPVSLKCRDRS